VAGLGCTFSLWKEFHSKQGLQPTSIHVTTLDTLCGCVHEVLCTNPMTETGLKNNFVSIFSLLDLGQRPGTVYPNNFHHGRWWRLVEICDMFIIDPFSTLLITNKNNIIYK
jgi:hypothetical protein